MSSNYFDWLNDLSSDEDIFAADKTAYENLSLYYSSYTDEYDYDRWFEYLSALSPHKITERSRVLDLGCGTGEMLMRFLNSGALVVGVDLSSEMLECADDNIFLMMEGTNRHILIRKDISDFCLSVKFDFIYSMGDTLNYLTEEDDLLRLFLNIKKMLRKKGAFTFDIINPDWFIDGATYEETVSIDEYDDTKLMFERRAGSSDGVRYLNTFVKVVDTSGVVLATEKHRQRIYSFEDILCYASQCGFVCRKVPFMNEEESCEKIQIIMSEK